MLNNSEKIEQEIIRMLKLSGFENKNEDKKSTINESNKKLIKEDDEFFDDINAAFEDNDDVNWAFDGLKTSGTKAILTAEMKLAMITLSISEFEKGVLEIYKNYNPRNFSKYIHKEKGTDVKPLGGAGPDLRRFKATQKNLNPKKNKHFNKEVERFDKTVRIAAVFMDPELTEDDVKNMIIKQQASLMRFWGKKVVSMISYNKGTLTDLGKSQIEFLARTAALTPADNFEEKLFSLTSKDVYSQNAKHVLRAFYTLAATPIVSNLLHRVKYHAEDSQISMWVASGMDDVLDKVSGHYDFGKSNFGAWAIQVIKNAVKNQVRARAEFKLDLNALEDKLSKEPLPIQVQSIAKPEETSGNWSRFRKDSDKIYMYIYDDPAEALKDFVRDGRSREKDEEGNPLKPSPLSLRFLTAKSKADFAKAFPPGTFKKPVGKNMLDTEPVNPYDTEAIFKVNTLPQEAKQTIFEILNQIAEVMLYDKENIKMPNGKTKTDIPDFGYMNKNYEKVFRTSKRIVDRKPGEEPVKIANPALIELMYELLSFGTAVQVYTKTWKYNNSKGGITTRAPGEPVVYKDGKPVPNINGIMPGDENTTTVMSTGSKGEELVKSQFIEIFLNNIREKGTISSNNPLIQKMENSKKDASGIITTVKDALDKFFGFEGLKVPILRKNRNKLNQIISNYSASMLAENKARKLIKNLLLKNIK